ncbi:MAG TPA: glycerophosphodiester phosphodiesterase family protein [Verrucomicrobiae bacterium]|nr:glycerophosphodiester phosphodiesterase family protein [Verrucomicrobiae bacterium]
MKHTLFPANATGVTLTAEKLIGLNYPLVIGHRGYCAIAPENTLPSFQLALTAGADLVELDYQHSKDGVPVVIHDHILDRTTDARKKWRCRRVKVSRTTAAEIQTLDAGTWFDSEYKGAKVPLLVEALDLICGSGRVALVERKSGDAATLAKLLRERNLLSQVVVIAFDWKFLRQLHELEPALILGALGPPVRLSNGRRPTRIRRGLAVRLNDLMKTGAKLAVWNHRVSRRAVQKAHRRGLRVWVYTINGVRQAQQLVARGVSGIITNDVNVIGKAL